MRLLAVIGGELMGADERSDWGVLEALIAANGPASIEIRVMALVNRPGTGMLSMPLGRAVGARTARSGSGPSSGYNPSDSARQRLDRALERLRGLGLRASGDIEPGDAYRAVRREAARGDYARVLFLVPRSAHMAKPSSWPQCGGPVAAVTRHSSGRSGPARS